MDKSDSLKPYQTYDCLKDDYNLDATIHPALN